MPRILPCAQRAVMRHPASYAWPMVVIVKASPSREMQFHEISIKECSIYVLNLIQESIAIFG